MFRFIAALLLVCTPVCADEGFFRPNTEPQRITQFVNGWFDGETPGFSTRGPSRFWKDSGGVVHLQGVVMLFPGQWFAGHAFTLPPGYCPEFDESFIIPTQGGVGMVLIRSTCDAWIATENSLVVSLSGITYRAR